MKTQIRTLLALAFGAALLTTGSPVRGLTIGTGVPTGPGVVLPGPRPTLVVLIHGGTSNPDSPLSPNDYEAGHHPDTLDYSRFYWDFPFTASVLGVSPGGTLFTRSGVALNRLNWATAAVNVNIMDNAFAMATRLPTMPNRKAMTAVGFVHANGASRLGVHTLTVLEQIDNLYREFATWTGADPYLVLVGHSKGGMVARYIMSAPSVSVGGTTLTPTQQDLCKTLRDKTKYIVTLGTPHTGSPLAEKGLEIVSAVNSSLQGVINGAYGTLRNAASAAGITLPAGSPINVSSITGIIASEAELTDLTGTATTTNNTGALRPDHMVRSDGSLIPMYCYGGRSPGDRFYNSPRHDGLGGPPSNTTEGKSASGLCTLDWALHNIAETTWGTRTSIGPGKNLDLMRRTFSIIGISPQALPPFIKVTKRFSNPGEVFQIPFTDFTFEGQPIYFQQNTGDMETDNDGMVPITSALAIDLGTNQAEPFDHTQGGQIYRMYGTASSPWAFNNHRTLSNAAPMGAEVGRLVRNAGPKISTGALSIF